MKFKKKWIILILILAVLAAVLWLLPDLLGSKVPPDAPSSPAVQETATAEPAAEPAGTAAPEEAAEPAGNSEPDAGEEKQEQPFLMQITENDPSTAYVLVRMPNAVGLLPLPTEGEYTRTIRQTMADGTEAINVLHLTANGFRMEDANCEGHDCINEGEVTLENREVRVLWNMVICLPHQLSLELITRDEALQMFGR